MPLIISLWTCGDVVSDCIQTSVYHKYQSVEDEVCKLSPSYFYISTVNIFIPPFMLTIQTYWTFGVYGSFSSWNEDLWSYRKFILQQPTTIRIFLMYFVVPLFTFCRVVFAYFIVLPCAALYLSIRHLWYGHTNMEEKFDNCSFTYTPVSLMMMQEHEQLLEGTPQIVLTVIFLFNNSGCHQYLRTYPILGFDIPTTMISLIFSCGSFIVGSVKFIHIFLYFFCQNPTRKSSISYSFKSKLLLEKQRRNSLQ